MLVSLRSLLLVLIFALAFAVACGGDDDDGGDSEGGSETTASATATEDGPTETEEPTETETDGDAPEGLAEYFEAMEDLGLRTDTKLEEIGDRMNNATYDSDEEEIAANEDAIQETGVTIESALLEMSDLDVPDEVRAEHDDFFDALNAVLQIFATLSIEIEDVSTSLELDAMFDSHGEELSQTDVDFDDACTALQAAGENYGLTPDLRCLN
jgi:hypothetical protein